MVCSSLSIAFEVILTRKGDYVKAIFFVLISFVVTGILFLPYRKSQDPDLNWKIGGYLAELSDNVSVDILKVSHHGTETTMPDTFFEKVSPQYAFVPAPKHLWTSDRSARIRKWFSDRNIRVYVNGISGDVGATVTGGVLSITSEY